MRAYKSHMSVPGPPTTFSKYLKNVWPFSYGTVENASSGFIPFKFTTKLVRGLSTPK